MNGGRAEISIRMVSVDDSPDALPVHEVHVYSTGMDRLLCAADRLRGTLSEGEVARARRFLAERDQIRFIVVRGLLRTLLGRYADLEPAALEIVSGPYGKPTLLGEAVSGGLRFNVSHSGGRALLAFARGREVGVDVEKVQSGFSGTGIGDRFFTAGEAACIRSFAGERRQEVFFSLWTLKEAVMKASGRGFSLPMDRFEVALDPPRVVRVDGDSSAASRWRLGTLSPGPGYAAAIAVEAVARAGGAGIL